MPSPGLPRRLAIRVAQAVVPVAASVVGAVMVWAETAGPTTEVQIVAPAEAAPGEVLPLRAQLFTGIERPQGPDLAEADIDVWLLTARPERSDGARPRVLAHARLVPGAARSMEGSLRVPLGLPPGDYGLAAASRDASVHTTLRVRASPAPLPITPRQGSALQGQWQGPIEPLTEAPIPDGLDVRVDGAVCVPESTCSLFVRVGRPPAAVRVVATPSVEPLSPPGVFEEAGFETGVPVGLAAEVTAGVARLDVRVHGFEAETTLIAYRDGTAVARRALRLPVALGEPACTAPRRVAAGAAPTLTVHADRPDRGIVVDAFLDGRWRHTASFPAAALGRPLSLPFALAPGRWRLQARTDPFSSASACARTLVAGPEDARALADDDAERAAVAVAPDADSTLAYVLADDDADRFATPVPASGREEAIARTLAAQARVRALAIAAIGLCASTLALYVVRRGLAASAQARRILVAAGATAAVDPLRRWRDTLTVLLVAAALVLAFLAAIALVVVRTALAPQVY
jgi:hypothetical protein